MNSTSGKIYRRHVLMVRRIESFSFDGREGEGQTAISLFLFFLNEFTVITNFLE